jgi:hypothetical protein
VTTKELARDRVDIEKITCIIVHERGYKKSIW